MQVSDDGHFLIISVFAGTAPQARIFVQDLELPGSQLRPLVDDFDNIADVVFAQDGTFYLVSDYQAEHKRLVAVDLERPEREHWTEIIGEAVRHAAGVLPVRRQVRLPLPARR